MSGISAVALVFVLVWTGVFAYVWTIDRRLSRLEKRP
jgi:CcmD family protein